MHTKIRLVIWCELLLLININNTHWSLVFSEIFKIASEKNTTRKQSFHSRNSRYSMEWYRTIAK